MKVIEKIAICILIMMLHAPFAYVQQTVWMHPNKGQWHQNIEYQVDLHMGKLYVEQNGFTYHFYDVPGGDHADHSHHHEHMHEHLNDSIQHHHVVRTHFIGSNASVRSIPNQQSPFYRNYFLGNDSSTWTTGVHSYASVIYPDFYPSIDLLLDGSDQQFKYSFVVSPGASPDVITWTIQGADTVFLDMLGNLTIETSLAKITELRPTAWTIKNGQKIPVNINFSISEQGIGFVFPNGFSAFDTLVIDPYIVFSSYSGSTTDNWGMTATPGINGETYAGGIDFGAGYPTTSGAYDTSYNGGTTYDQLTGFDVAISKFDNTGANLLFSTYLGGNANELPESMIVAPNGDLYVLGITASPNFPMNGNSYQATFAGGPTATQISLRFVGTDLFIAKFNESGTQLLASTYMGGSDLDGFNSTQLSYNYGDQFRGEIILDGADILVVSHTRSTNFPVTNTSTRQGDQDAVAFRMNGTLSSLQWSSYYGGSDIETGHAIALSSTGDVFIAGGTASSNFSFSGHTTIYSGNKDGYILKLNGNTGAIIGGTYIGGTNYDQCYFVQTNIDDEVYVFGQTQSSGWSITPGRYGNANSGQFIRKYNNNLSAILWTTLIGAGTGNVEISPTAFLISDCNDIMLSGWGGQINKSNLPLNQAKQSTTTGFPITSDAYQSATNGSSFYLALLSKDATNLSYATFLGSTSPTHNQHVDGGTSRFDKGGAIYHAVCASCGSNNTNGFMSTPGVWSTTNAAKFQLGTEYKVSSTSYVCDGGTIQLSATGGTSYNWSPAQTLNDPTSATPIATPTETTMYYVTISFDEGCDIIDSVLVEVIHPPVLSVEETQNLCLNDTITLSASGGHTYLWSPNIEIDNPTASSIHVFATQSRYYYVSITNDCYHTMDSVFVDVLPLPDVILANDTTLCIGGSAHIVPKGDLSVSWIYDPTLESHPDGSATMTPSVPQYYYINGIDSNGCKNRDSIWIDFFVLPNISITPDTSICFGESLLLNVMGGTSYVWSPAQTLNDPTSATPIATPTEPTTYTVTIAYANNCIVSDSVKITLLYLPKVEFPPEVLVCYGETSTISVGGANTYSWTPATYLNTTTSAEVIITPYDDIVYTITFTNICGSIEGTIEVYVIVPHVDALQDTIICPGTSTPLSASGSLHYEWIPHDGILDPFQSSVMVTPSLPTYYIVIGTDKYGCQAYDTVFVDLYDQPYIIASPQKQYLLQGDTAKIVATTSFTGMIQWNPSDYLSCSTCLEITAHPPKDYHYTVYILDENGCSASADAWIYFDPLLYVPNAFTPDKDQLNGEFLVTAGNIRNFRLFIFDRWGQIIFESKRIDQGWDGTYRGQECQDGVYTWKIEYEDLRQTPHELIGHVTLIR